MWLMLLGLAKGIGGYLLSYLNTKVEAEQQIQITSINAQATVSGAALNAQANADNANARLREKGEKWSSPAIVFMTAVLAPLVWHEWQVVLDSSRFVLGVETWYGIPYPVVVEHVVGSWRVAALPGAWDATEQAIFQSLFIGASVAVAGIAAIKALRR